MRIFNTIDVDVKKIFKSAVFELNLSHQNKGWAHGISAKTYASKKTLYKRGFAAAKLAGKTNNHGMISRRAN